MKRILVIKMRYIGDTVLMTPLINTLANSLPTACIDVLVNAQSGPILDNQPGIGRVWTYASLPNAKQLVNVIPLLWKIWRQNYDLVIDLTNNDRSSLFTFCSRARIRIGFQSEHHLRQRLAYTQVIDSYLDTLHTVDHHLKAAEVLGFPIAARQPVLHVSEEQTENIKRQLAVAGINGQQRYMVIHPGARRWYKSWPLERFAQLADRVVRELNIPVVLSGGPTDRNNCRIIIDHAEEKLINLCARVSLFNLPALIKGAVCLVGNDSASIHIATAVTTPTIALFGPTDWKSWQPRGPRDKVIAVELPCRPCGHSNPDCPLGDDYCMGRISFDQVWEAVLERVP